MKILPVYLLLSALLLTAQAVAGAENATAEETASDNAAFAEKIHDLKQQVLELNRDLFILEEELLFPVNTQISVFVSIDADYLFALDSVRLTIDDKVVSNYLYTARELEALHRGGVQRLFMGNLTTGEHELTAIFTGKGPAGRDYKRATTHTIRKNDEARFVELKIVANVSREQPEFRVRSWE